MSKKKRYLKKTAAAAIAASLVLPANMSPAFAATTTVKKTVSSSKTTTAQKQKKSKWSEASNAANKTAAQTKASFVAPQKTEYATDRVIVKFKDNANASQTITKHNLKKSQKLTLIDAEVVQIPEGKDVQTVVAEMAKDSNVLYVQPDYKVYLTQTPNDPQYSNLWGLNNTGQLILGTPGTSNVDIDAAEAWDVTMGSNSVTVAVIDEGVDTSHPDLRNNIWTNPGEIAGNNIDDDRNGYIDDVHGYDFFNDDGSVYDSADGDQHGTHVAGTIAALGNNSNGIIGVAPNVKVMSLKFLGPNGGYTSDAVRAVEYASAMGAKLSNNSWGGGGYNQALSDAIQNSRMLFVAAAGNNGVNIDVSPFYPASYSASNILSVAAVDNRGQLASFSNYGASTVDVAAPGVNILSTLPNGQYEYYNGTSMATPHVAGAAALLYSRNPNLSPEEVINTLKTTGKPLSSLQGRVNSGNLISAKNALGTATPPPPPATDDEIPGVPFLGGVQDSLNASSDQNDVFSVYLEQGEEFNVSLTGDAGTDFDLYMYSPESETVNTSEGILAFSENIGTSDERITFTAPAAGTYYINTFAYSGSGNYNLWAKNGPGTYEETNKEISYTGSWGSIINPIYSGGSTKQLNAKGSAEFNFYGTSIEWLGFKGPQSGIANVYIDGELIGTPSLYSASYLYNQVLFNYSVPLGLHKIKIEWTGKRDPLGRKTSTNINIDALRVSMVQDGQAPVITQLNPADGSTVGQTFNLTGTATDDNDVREVFVSYSYYAEGKRMQRTHKLPTRAMDMNTKATATYDFNIPVDVVAEGISEGPFWVDVWAVDGAGNQSSRVSRTYNYVAQDTEAPVIESLSPDNGATVGSQFNVTGVATDNKNVQDVWVNYSYNTEGQRVQKSKKVQVNTQNGIKADTYNFDMLIDLAAEGAIDGEVQLEAWAVDASGNESARTYRTYNYVEQDNEAPIIQTLEPQDGATVDAQFNITGTATDNKQVQDVWVSYSYTEAGEKVEKKEKVQLQPTVENGKATDIYSFEIPVDLAADGAVEGPVSIEAWAVDVNGLESAHISRTYNYIVADTEAPVIQEVTPEDGATVGQGFYTSGYVTDNKQVNYVWVDYWYYGASGEKVQKTEKVEVSKKDGNQTAEDVYYFSEWIPVYSPVDGQVYITVRAVDMTGNEAAPVYRTYNYEAPDYEAPIIQSVTPNDGETVGQDFTVSGTVTDNKQVSDAWVYYSYMENGEKVERREKVQLQQNENTKAEHVYTFDYAIHTDLPSNTDIAVEVYAQDTFGNYAAPVYRTYHYVAPDTEAPVIEALSPEDGATVNSQFTLTGTATDNKQVQDVWVTYSYTEAGQKVEKSQNLPVKQGENSKASDSYQFEIDVDLAAEGAVEGPVSIEAWAVDAAGNQSSPISRTYNYVIPDTQAPVIETLEPQDGATVGPQFNITGTATDNKEVYDVWVNYSYTEAGQTIEKQQKVEVNRGELNGKASDSYSFEIPVDLAAEGALEGPVSVEAWAVDSSGLESERVSRTYNYVIPDTEAPVIQEVTPGEGEVVGESFYVSSYVTDNKQVSYAWVDYWYYDASGEKVQKTEKVEVKQQTDNQTAEDVYYFGEWISVYSPVDGQVSVTVRAVDTSGNEAAPVTRTYNYEAPDYEAPVIQSVSPEDGATVGQEFTISGTVTDNKEVSEVWVDYSYVENGEQVVKKQKVQVQQMENTTAEHTYNFSYPIYTNLPSNTDIAISVYAQDAVGNYAAPVFLTYHYVAPDTEAPVIEALSPEDGATVNSQFTLTGTATDNKQVQDVWVTYSYTEAGQKIEKSQKLPVKQGENQTASDSYQFEILVDLAADGVAEGPVTIEAWALDAAGNQSVPVARTYNYEVPDVIAPVIETLNPEEGATVGPQFNVTGIATDNKQVYDVWVDYSYTVAGQTVEKQQKVQVKPGDLNGKASDSYSFDIPVDLAVEGAAEGPVTIEAWAVDAFGNQSERVTRTYNYEVPDTMAPVVESLNPADGTALSPQFTVAGSVVDNKNVQDVWVKYVYTANGQSVEGVQKAPISEDHSSSKSFDYYIDLEALGAQDGTVRIEVWAVDTAGNQSATVTRTYSYISPDYEAPVIQTLTPAEGSVVGSQFNVTATVTDNKQAERFFAEFTYYTTVAGQKVQRTQKQELPVKSLNQKTSSSREFTKLMNLTELGAVEGAVSIRTWAEDNAGNQSTQVLRTYNYLTKVRVEDTDSRITYNSAWTASSNTRYSGGTVKYKNTLGASAELSFYGKGVRWIALKSTGYGYADVYIDDVLVQRVSLYNASSIYQQTVYENLNLLYGQHKIKIVNRAEKVVSSGSVNINLDAFEILQ